MHGSRGQAGLTRLFRVCAEYGSLGLKSFGIVHSDLSEPMIWSLMTFHAKSLEKLIILDTERVGSFDPTLLFTSCPQLRHLETSVWGGRTWIQDVVGSPWVCTDSLRILRLTVCQEDMKRFGGGSPSTIWQRLFWKRIGEVENLETLDLEMAQAHPPYPRIISIVQDDLDPICALKRLRELRVLQWQESMHAAIKEDLQRRRPGLSIHLCGTVLNVDSPEEWATYPRR